MNLDFQTTLKEEFEKFLLAQQQRFPAGEILKIDLHCHDYNSDVPDELIGRIRCIIIPQGKRFRRLSSTRCCWCSSALKY